MNIQLKGKYHAIESFEWNNIPPLAIITGINGVGKTQLLTLIHQYYHRKSYPNIKIDIPENIKIDNLNIPHNEVGYWGPSGAAFPGEGNKFSAVDIQEIALEIISKIDKEKRALIDRIHPKPNNQALGRITNQKFRNIVNSKDELIISSIEAKLGKKRNDFSLTDIAFNLPEQILLGDQDIITSDSIEMLFYMYQYKKAAGLRNGQSENSFSTPPWEILNDVLAISNLPYRVNHPDLSEIKDFLENQMNIVSSVMIN